MIAVERRGVHMMGRAYLYMVHLRSTTQGLHAVLLRVGIMSYMCFLLILLPTQNSDHTTYHHY